MATGGWDTRFKQSHMIIATATQKHCGESQNYITKYNNINSENAVRDWLTFSLYSLCVQLTYLAWQSIGLDGGEREGSTVTRPLSEH